MKTKEFNLKKCTEIKNYLEKASGFKNIGEINGDRVLCDVRKLYCYLCRKLTKSSLNEVGQALRIGYDHASVIYNVNKFHDLNQIKMLHCQNLVEQSEKDLHYILIQYIEMNNKKEQNRDRWDIYNNLPKGANKQLAEKLNCKKSYITLVLQGKRSDTKGIIKEAELMAALNIWKTRFCKLQESQL